VEINTYGYVRADGYVCVGSHGSSGYPKFISPCSQTKYQLAKHLRRIKSRAEEKSISFDLDVDYLQSIWPEDGRCPALGITLIRGSKGGRGGPTDDSPSLDRIIPELGYVRGNVQWLSQKANCIKQDATGEELRKVADYVSRIEATIPHPTSH